MSIPGSVNPLFLGAAGQATGGGEYQIERSVRFNSPDSAYLSRTPASSGNRKTWTWAGWVKKTTNGGDYKSFFTAFNSASAYTALDFADTDALRITAVGGGSMALVTSAVYRDLSSWYHVVVAVDTTQATASNRAKVYVNGTEVTTFGAATYPGLNTDTEISSAFNHQIGRNPYPGYPQPFNGLLADIHFIDSQALTPSAFGEFDTNGVWQPIDASELTYGTNGFHLPFSDNSTAAALGTDTSGNGNTWTVNNISVGAGGNTSQYWSATASIAGQAGYEATKAFDGDASSASSTYYFPGTDGTGTFTFAQSVPYSTIKIWYGRTNGSLFVNGVDMEIATTGYAEIDQEYLASKGVTSPLVSIGLERVSAGNGAYLFGVQVNGSQLIDSIYNAGNDSLVDSPTNYGTDTGAGGEVRGNYATLNPNMTRDFYITYSNGNLDFTQEAATGGAQQMSTQATIGVASGKWYWEVTKVSTDNTLIGVAVSMDANADAAPSAGYIYYNKDGSFGGIGFTLPSSGASNTAGDVIGVALDADNRTVQFFKNGASQGTATNGPTGQTWFPSTGVWTSSDPGGATYNFGQRQWAYAAPAGFKALCTTNLDSETITTSGSYTGNGVADGPFVYLNGVPTAMTVGGNAVTFGTHADKLSNGFKIRTTSTTYNQNASTYNYTITSTGDPFKRARAQANP